MISDASPCLSLVLSACFLQDFTSLPFRQKLMRPLFPFHHNKGDALFLTTRCETVAPSIFLERFSSLDRNCSSFLYLPFPRVATSP